MRLIASSQSPTEPTAGRTIANRVADHLRLQIVAGQLSPGDRVKERELATALGVKRGPVREALRLLEREGLLTIKPYSGARVVLIDKAEIAEIVALRRQVEYFSVGNASLARDTKLVAELRNIASEMRLAHERQDRMRLLNLDVMFHLRICEASGHATLILVMQTLLPRLMLLWYPNAFKAHTPESFEESHLKLVRAIENRDMTEALEAVDHHIKNFTVDLEIRSASLPQAAMALP
jgi:DNA-binding GntR family transcriptional regulator